jgi:hypothetical protein
MANMMNMASQQRAAQLQGQRIRQEMDYAAAAEGRAAETQASAQKKAELEYVGLVADQFSRDVGKLKEGDIAGAEALRANIVAQIPAWGDYIRPASEWTKDYRVQLMLKGKEIADKTIPDVVASKEYAAAGARDAQGNPIPEGTVIDTRIGGFEGAAGSTPLKERSAATPAPGATPTAPPTAVGADVDMRATRGANTTPQDLIDQGMNPNNIPSGMPTSAASFTRGGMAAPATGPMTPEMAQQIVDDAVKTGMMAQADFDQLIALAPEQNKQPFMDMLKANNIALQHGGAGQQPQFADLRGQRMQSQTAGLRGAPPMEQTLAQYIPVQRRDPNVAPTPSPVPATVLGAQEGAKTAASKNVELKMNPVIAAATKKAERAVEKRSEAIIAKNETKTLVQSIDSYIAEIDALLRSADRRFIVGRIEGNLHYLGSLGQNERQAELQAMFDRIKSADTLGSLVEMKQATPSGGSPVGNASNQDVQLVAKGANTLTQTGGVPKFDADLKKLRRDAYRTRQNAIEFYNDRYGDLSAEDPKFKLNVRPIADRYISSKDLLKKPVRTPTKSTLSPATRAKYGL